MSPPCWNQQPLGGVPSLRIGRRVPPTPAGSFTSQVGNCKNLLPLHFGNAIIRFAQRPRSSKGQSEALLTPRLWVRLPPGAPLCEIKAPPEAGLNGWYHTSTLNCRIPRFHHRHQDQSQSRFLRACGEPTTVAPVPARFLPTELP